MRTFSLLSVFVALAVSAVYGEAAHDDSDVIELKAESFKALVDNEPLVLVEFMAPWCGHCKALAPEYATAATTLKSQGIKLAKVDCTAEQDLCSEQGVSGYPTLKVFTKGSSSDYGGPRKADGIVSFMVKRSRPVVSYLSPANHTEFSQSDRVVVVAYLDPTDTANLGVFKSYAEGHRDDYAFGWAHELKDIKEVGDIKKPSVVVWKKFDEGRNDHHAEKLSEESISEFVKAAAVPLLDEVSPANFQLYAEAGLPLAYLFVEANNPHRESVIKALEPVARTHKGKINFVWIDANKFADHAKALNLVENNWPAFVIQNIGAQTKFPLDQKKTVDVDSVTHFVQEFVDGKLSPSLKSEPIPKKQSPGAFTLVTDEFDSAVYGNDNKKDVFIEFYAPWCGHCKRLKPVWDNLAHSFKGAGDALLIAKFDATENDVPPSTGIQVQGFPTLKFKKAGTKEFIDYQGDRSLDSLIEFVEQHSSHEAVKVEIAEEESEQAASQVVLEDESGEEEDRDAEHDEL